MLDQLERSLCLETLASTNRLASTSRSAGDTMTSPKARIDKPAKPGKSGNAARPYTRKPPQPLHKIFAHPALLAALGLTGLILGLTGDGWRDVMSWVLAGLPISYFLRHWPKRH